MTLFVKRHQERYAVAARCSTSTKASTKGKKEIKKSVKVESIQLLSMDLN